MALAIDIWSDIACPWCWIGKRRLEAAIDAFAAGVTLTWRAFELDPSASTDSSERLVDEHERRLLQRRRQDELRLRLACSWRTMIGSLEL